MIGALWTGISGLAGQQTALDNESNNIANVNTIGYKASRISFADQMYQNKIGKGTTIVDAEKLYKQGNLKVTGVAFDMALSGNGFFAVSNTQGAGMAETYYTRAGNFRMGDNGTLQDAAGNSVQGWAMVGLSDADIVSTDQNIKRFTTDFVKMGSSQIIRNTNTIESITAKMTDYTESAVADSEDVFTGAGWKTKSSKVSDIEGLISSYTEALIDYKNQPDGTSVTPGLYKNTLDFSTAVSGGVLDGDGDTISVYIDGSKYTQVWDTDLTTTLKAFSDQLSSKIKGVNAWVTDNADNSTDFPRTPTDVGGYFRIESLIPGKTLTISQLAITTSTGAATPGALSDLSVKVEAGSGYAAVTASRDALKEAVTGKQQDVYTTTDLGAPGGDKDFTYQLTIFDPIGNQNISVPSSPLAIDDKSSIDDIVAAINHKAGVSAVPGELPYYVEAFNINGNLVIETLDSNYDLEISSDLKQLQYGTTKTTTGAAGVSEVHSFDLTTKPTPNNVADYTLDIGGTTVTVANPADMVALRDAINGNAGVAALVTASINASGDLVLTEVASAGVGFDPVLTVDAAGDTVYDLLDVPRNATHSGREGAGAEFLEITSVIEQTGARGEMQLKLNSLGISNSPFGDFQVDSTGLITMKQDGATFAVGQVAIALFNDNRGLLPVGDNLLQANERSGTPIFNLNNNKTASVKANTLELSTADLSESLVNLMVFQRAFEANAKSITTADAVLNTLINLKR